MTIHNLPTSFVTPTGDTTTVRETPARTGPQIPACEMHARRIAREAEAWLELATARTRQRPDTLRRKAFDAVTFSVARRASSLAVPSKLAGVSRYQRQLWTMVREQAAPWSPLEIHDTGDGLAVLYYGDPVGEVQTKQHLGWVRPLVPFGLRLYLSRVTGTDRDRATLGCNVVFGHVGDAVGRLTDALAGLTPPADARLASLVSSGDGTAGEAPKALFGPPAIRLQAERGDGASSPADGLALVVGGVPVRDEHEALTGHADDIVCFRTVTGEARMSIPHVVQHSPTGIDWGAGAGRAGLADFALSVLTHVSGGRDRGPARYTLRRRRRVPAALPRRRDPSWRRPALDPAHDGRRTAPLGTHREPGALASPSQLTDREAGLHPWGPASRRF